ncbi:hypothetical protein CDD81_814 [Ophiocordyceps australis]|uniref:Uncharacterized protein n=1 Tax=Ophiocordyceps australis TaxID=1399860 RepID=A0A2C5Y048_9HYPO|nr:hypothetical protein CDD81_814 [Ophiocordyceps australis]
MEYLEISAGASYNGHIGYWLSLASQAVASSTWWPTNNATSAQLERGLCFWPRSIHVCRRCLEVFFTVVAFPGRLV